MIAAARHTNAAQTAKKRALGLIFSIMLMDVVGLSMMYPVAPYIVLRYSSDALMVTMFTVIYAAAQFLAAPILGVLGDRYGRRPILIISVLGAAVGYVILGIGGALWVLFLARLVAGITGGNMSTASAYIADVSGPQERAANYTLVGMAWGLGLVLGPAAGASLGQLSLAAPAYLAAALSLANALLALFWLPESLPKERRTTAPVRAAVLNPLASIAAMAGQRGLGRLLLVSCLFNLAFNGITSTESLFMIQRFAAQPWQVGLRLALAGLALALAQAVAVSRLVPRYGEQAIAVVCILEQACGALAAFVIPAFWPFCAVTIGNTAVSSLIFPTLTALTTNRVSPDEQGRLLGVTTALASLMGVVGPLWAGAVYSRVMPGAPYWASAALYVLAAWVLSRYRARARPLMVP